MASAGSAGPQGGGLGAGPRTKVRRMPSRGRYDRASIYGILDGAFVCHLGYTRQGQPMVVPMVFGRQGDSLYLHGAPANATLAPARQEQEACVAVTLVDALVLARSAFHQSVNYRSVVAFGPLCDVPDLEQKRRALEVIVDHVMPGRSRDTRPPTDTELRATKVARFDISEASAKIRDGGPTEEPEDLVPGPFWAGTVPLLTSLGPPVVDTQAPVDVPPPPYLTYHPALGFPGKAGARSQV